MESTNQSEPQDIRKRVYAYALRAIRVYRYLQKRRDGAGWILGKQYLRAATSIGANIEEAQASESRADFAHKMGIAQKEARESLYWLRLIADSHVASNSLFRELTQETNELIAVITAIVVNTKLGKVA
ncbi:MAG TPA: four helix bundle protein [Terriglobia bacterium]|nr:four helix bundle protein [Terriglobia bacterium]